MAVGADHYLGLQCAWSKMFILLKYLKKVCRYLRFILTGSNSSFVSCSPGTDARRLPGVATAGRREVHPETDRAAQRTGRAVSTHQMVSLYFLPDRDRSSGG